MRSLFQLLELLKLSEKIEGLKILFLILIMAILDMLGVASILPFIALLSDRTVIETNTYIKWAHEFLMGFGVKTAEDFLFIVGLSVFGVLVFSLSFKAFVVFKQTSFARNVEYSIGARMFDGYLSQPYLMLAARNSADMGRNVLSEVEAVVGGGIMPAIALITQSAVMLAILVMLLFVDPLLVVLVGTVLGVTYASLFFYVNEKLKVIGEARTISNLKRFSIINEAFSAFKDVKYGGLELFYLARFQPPSNEYAVGQAAAQIYGLLPRYLLEAIAFGGLLLVLLYYLAGGMNFGQILPVIALYAYAGYRLLPAMQQVYAALTQLSYTANAISAFHGDFTKLNENRVKKNSAHQFNFDNQISLSNVSFSYNGGNGAGLKQVNLIINANTIVGVVGKTGSGKTTLVDLILGLVPAQFGEFKVDQRIISSENVQSWQSAVGYVPQQIYLADDTVRANIAFGCPESSIDHDRLLRASRIANLHEFVTNELPGAYECIIGERGVRLSGGQQQRIAIARAVYREPSVLILDEGTSALDNLTEEKVVKALQNLKEKMTVIFVAHRLSTVKACDQIIVMDSGKIIGSGDYESLMKTNKLFQEMTSVGR